METEIMLDIVEAFAKSALTFSIACAEIVRKYRGKEVTEVVGMEPENRKTDVHNLVKVKEEPKRHKWKDCYDCGLIDHRVWTAVERRFPIALRESDKLCVEDFSKITERQMWCFRGIGTHNMAQIAAVMGKYGVKFKGEEQA